MMNNLKSHNTVTGNIVYIGPKTARGQIEVREVFYSSLVMLVDIGTVIGSKYSSNTTFSKILFHGTY